MGTMSRTIDHETGEIVTSQNGPGALVSSNFEFTTTGALVHGDPTYEEWYEMFTTLKRIESGVQWWLGDMLNYGETRWGEKYSQALNKTDYSYQGLADCAYTADKIDFSRRREKLSFSHHREVAPLGPDEQEYWLALAEEGDGDEPWSKSKLRNEIRKYKQEQRLAEQEPPDVTEDNNIIHGDCLAVSWPADINLIIADPPFGLSENGQSGVRIGKGEWDELDYVGIHEFNQSWLTKAVTHLADSGSIFVFGTVHNIFSVGHILKSMGCYIVRNIVWNKPFVQRAMNLNALVPSHELIIWARKGDSHTCNLHEVTRDVWDVQPAAPHGHPTEKPEALVEKIVELASNPGQLVMDPFLGSGTTTAVAKRLKRAFFGVEQDEYWWKIATKRTREESVL